MADKFYCDICGAPMKLKENLPNHKKYRRRRFTCTICDFKKTIFAGGKNDEEIYPERGIKIAQRIARQEEENRDF